MDFSHIKSRLEKPTTSQTWYGVEVVDYLRTEIDIPNKGPFGYTTWLKLVKDNQLSIFQARKLVEIMKVTENWLLKEKREKLHRGKWLFNRFRYEIKDMGVDKFISSKS